MLLKVQVFLFLLFFPFEGEAWMWKLAVGHVHRRVSSSTAGAAGVSAARRSKLVCQRMALAGARGKRAAQPN